LENNLDILILAGGDIRNKFSYVKNNCSCPALIPINTKPIVSYILEFYANHSDQWERIFLVVNKKEIQSVSKEISVFLNDERVLLVGVGDTIGVIDTLDKALKDIKPSGEVIINLVTTVPTSFPDAQEVQLSELENRNDEWSVIQTTDHAFRVYPKVSEKSVVGNAFTGLFRANSTVLLDVLKTTESQDLVELIQPLATREKILFCPVEWIDCGHEINYVEAKKKLINSRAFNQISVSDTGVLTKSSENADKLRKEVDYVEKLPKPLSLYFPRILDSYSQGDRHFVEMEFHPYPNLAEITLYWEVNEKIWDKIFTRFQSILTEFAQTEGQISQKSYMEMYLDKTLDRLNDFHGQRTDEKLNQETIEINGKSYLNVDFFKDQLQNHFGERYGSERFHIMHGDFCFNNLLYDIPSDSLKLIDARGSFGNGFSIYGDRNYDIAKLVHSSVFGYDYLVNDLFELTETETGFQLELNWRENRELLTQKTETLIDTLKVDKKHVYLITALLFLSMTPLHSDSSRRQIAMFLTGIQLLNDTLSE